MATTKSQNRRYIDLLTAFPAGINSGVAALLLPKDQAAWAINTTFRGGYATDRPPVQKLTLDFGGDDDLESAVRGGFFQGAQVYRPDFGDSQVVAQISGRLFRFIQNDDVWDVAEITISGDANSATAPRVWMWQSEKWLIISDGTATLPIFYDGVSCRRSYGASQILGVVDAAVPAGVNDIGTVITATMSVAYSGPYNISVYFNGGFYQTLATPGATPSYPIVLTNVAAIPGGAISTGDQVVQRSDVICRTVDITTFAAISPPTALFPTGWGMSTYVSSSVTSIVVGDEIMVDGRLCHVNSTTVAGSKLIVQAYVVSPLPSSNYVLAAGIVVSDASASPSVILGTIVTGGVVPAVGATVSLTMDVPYSGAAGVTAWINDDQYTIEAGPDPAPSTTLYLLNLSDTTAIPAAGPPGFPQNLVSVGEIPACRMGAYGLGQNWFSLTDGISFANSDVVGAASGTQAESYRDAVLKTSNYAVMGSFRLPGSGEIITSMTFVATLDQALGQGPLQVGVPSGMFSCKAPFDLTDFQGLGVVNPIATPILTKSLLGNGPIAQNSTILSNSDTVFRQLDGVGSLILARRAFSDIGGNTPISREMTRVLDRDIKSLLPYGSAIVFDNRLRMTCAPQVSAQGVFHLGELILNYDLLSSLRGKAAPVWEGLWTGLNNLQYIQGLFGTVSRAFAFTFNITDDQIELYELLPTGTAHFDNGSTRIKWVIETPVIFNQDIKTLSDVARLLDGEIYLSDINGQVDVTVLYRPVFYPCWRPWHTFSVCSDMSASNAKEQTMWPLGFGEPSNRDCDDINEISFRDGVGFQLRFEITGHCKIWGIKCLAEQQPNPAFTKPAGTCDANVAPTCKALNCDVPDDYEIYSLDGLPPTPTVPVVVSKPYTNPAVYYDMGCVDSFITYTGPTLPDWITIDTDNNRLIGKAGIASGTTQAEATATAQSSLDNFGDAAVAAGTLACTFPEVESIVTGLGVGSPSQSTWDPDNGFIWTARGYNGSGLQIDRVDVSDLSIGAFVPSAIMWGIQYVPDYGTGTLQGQRIWFNRSTVIGEMLATAPFTETNVFTAIPSNISASYLAPALWVPEKNMLFAAQGFFNPGVGLRFQSIDFITGVKTITNLTTVLYNGNNYTYNPERDEIIVGGYAIVDIASLTASLIGLTAGYTEQGTSAYCPDNGYIYIPYVHAGTYGVALMSASDHTILEYVDISTTYIKGVVYNPNRQFMYVYGSTKLTLIDTRKYGQGAASIVGNVTGITDTMSGPTGVYCTTSNRVYIAVASKMYVIT